MIANFDYRAVAYTIPAGESRRFDALAFLMLLSATSSVEISPMNKAGSFGPLRLNQSFESPDGVVPIGPVNIRNPTGAPVTITIATSTHRIVVSPTSSAQSTTLDGASITLPVSIANPVTVQGKAAHGAVVVDNPELVAAEARVSERAATAEGNVDRLVADAVGKLIVFPFTNPENIENGKSAACVGAAGTANILAAGAAGFRHYVTDLLIDNPTVTASQWQVLDGATVIASGEVAANAQAVVNFSVPLRGTAATALVLKQTAAAGLIGYSSGFKGA